MSLYRTPSSYPWIRRGAVCFSTPRPARQEIVVLAPEALPPLLPVCSTYTPIPLHHTHVYISWEIKKGQPVKRRWRTYFWTVIKNNCIHRLQAWKHLASWKRWRPQLVLAIFTHPRYSQFTPVANLATPSPTWWSPETASRNTQLLPTTEYLHPIDFTKSRLYHHIQWWWWLISTAIKGLSYFWIYFDIGRYWRILVEHFF